MNHYTTITCPIISNNNRRINPRYIMYKTSNVIQTSQTRPNLIRATNYRSTNKQQEPTTRVYAHFTRIQLFAYPSNSCHN